MRVAGIDCGTNSIRLLISEVGDEGLCDVVRVMEIVRLGQGIDETGMFDEQALSRTLDKVSDYAQMCREYGVTSVRFAATSATRDASNRARFINGVRERLGVDVQVLSGEEEARTSFDGASSVLANNFFGTTALAIDLGGGSTELVVGNIGGDIHAGYSMNIGSVRMHERHLRSQPPTKEELASARMDIRAALDEAEQHVSLSQAQEVIGLAGTVTSVAARFLNLDTYDSKRVHGLRMSHADVLRTCDWFVSSPIERIASLGFMHPGRVDVITSGALVWAEVVDRIAMRMEEKGKSFKGIIVSEHDILDGLALWAAREPQHPQWDC